MELNWVNYHNFLYLQCITYTIALDSEGEGDAHIQDDEVTSQKPQEETTQSEQDKTTQPSEEITTQASQEVTTKGPSQPETTPASTKQTETTPPPPTTEQPEITPPPSVSEPPEFTCKHVGRFPYPNSCNKYYYCWSTEYPYHVFKCPRAFDPVSKYCVDHFNVCSLAPTCKADREVFAYPDDPTAYFECKRVKKAGIISYQIEREYCAKGREFNETVGYCELIDNAGTEPNSEESDYSICSKIGVSIDFGDDTRYYECIVKNVSKGELKAIKRKCPKDTMFNGDTLKCVPIAR